LLNVEVELDIIPIHIDELPDNINITPQQLIYLDRFIIQE